MQLGLTFDILKDNNVVLKESFLHLHSNRIASMIEKYVFMLIELSDLSKSKAKNLYYEKLILSKYFNWKLKSS
jgi:hypothetical protein